MPLALALAGCSAREDMELAPSDFRSCSALLDVVRPSERSTDAEHAVWLVSEPGRELPWVVNWQDRRIQGKPARLFEHAGRQWLVSDDHALSAAWVRSDQRGGQWLKCTPPYNAFDYVAVPLAPIANRGRGIREVARYPSEESAWPHLTFDLTLQRPGLLAIARGEDGLRWLEVEPQRGLVTEVGHLSALLGDDYNDVAAIDERYLAVASRRLGLVIVDAAEPERPRVVADSLPQLGPSDGHSVFVAGARLYLAQAPAAGTGAVVAFDVSEPETPRQLWRWKAEPGHDAHDVAVRGDHLYVSSIRGGITLLDASGDEPPRLVARRRGLGAHSCSVLDDREERLLWGEERVGGSLHVIGVERAGDEAMLSDSRLIADARSPGEPDGAAGAFVPFGFAASPHHSECRGAVCFVAHYQLGLRVLDIGGITEPAVGVAIAPLLADYPTWRPSARSEASWLRGASGVVLDLPWVYVADTDVGVLVLRYDAATPNEQRPNQ